MDEIIEILKGIRDDVDFTTEKNLIDGNILESFDVVTIVAEITDKFGINIKASDIIPENFNSAEDILNLVNKYR